MQTHGSDLMQSSYKLVRSMQVHISIMMYVQVAACKRVIALELPASSPLPTAQVVEPLLTS